MKKILSLLIIILSGQMCNLFAIEYEELFNNGQVAELRSEIYSKPHFDEKELPRAAFYESLVTSKDFDQTLQELIEGFPEIEYKDQVNFKLGIINFFQRKYSQAEFYFAKVENSDQFNEYNYWLARLYFMKQEHKQSTSYAGKFLKSCGKIDHKYELSYYMLIENSISENNFQKAVVMAEELLLNKPEGINKAYLFYRIGYSYERLENVNLAVANYKNSFEINPYGQYAALTEERLFEIRKSIDRNIDISFLYTKNYPSEINQKPIAYKTEPKEFNVTDLVRTDTSTVLSKFFNNQYVEKDSLQSQVEPLNEPNNRIVQNDTEPLIDNNNLAKENVVSELREDERFDILRNNLRMNDRERIRENRVIEPATSHNDSQDGTFIERPNNIETEGYIYLMNKPVGKYFIQLGRFSSKEFAVNRTKELFYLQQTWNVFRDVRGSTITYVIWSKPYETAAKAKDDIAKFKSQNIDCFLVSND